MDAGSFFGTDKVSGEMAVQLREYTEYERTHDLE